MALRKPFHEAQGVVSGSSANIGQLSHAQYGKDKVRLLRVVRGENKWHRVVEYTVCLTVEGRIEESYTKGDNGVVVATDSSMFRAFNRSVSNSLLVKNIINCTNSFLYSASSDSFWFQIWQKYLHISFLRNYLLYTSERTSSLDMTTLPKLW